MMKIIVAAQHQDCQDTGDYQSPPPDTYPPDLQSSAPSSLLSGAGCYLWSD